jgi:putative ABC transport system ATP-binding protein
MSALEAHELYRFFHIGDDEAVALRGVSLTVSEGEIVAVVGPSGSGKSTLLSCITGLDEPDGGWVEIAGQRMTRRPEAERCTIRARKFGIMLQGANLFAHLTVEQNIRFQMQLAGKTDKKRVDFLLDSTDLDRRASAYPTELSGGEVARTALAVALAADPPILVADEPTAEVDSESEHRLIELIENRRGSEGATLLATHSLTLARKADRILTLRDGRVVDG